MSIAEHEVPEQEVAMIPFDDNPTNIVTDYTAVSTTTMEDGNSTPYSGLVFHVLIHILSILQEPKYVHFQPVIDAYISDHFAAALVCKGLLSCVRLCADMVPSTLCVQSHCGQWAAVCGSH